ncbi:MAG: response regulator, partial [Oscillospiraceae bacterium]
MFKLVIADDEIRIREGFMRIVNWADMRFQVTGCYSDGSYVLEHLRREHVDVVLTDIKMKNISGLDLAQKIKEEYPNTYCVLVSAYQEFDFAHQAIALGVKDYLFKPTRLNDIRRVFVKLAQDLEHESELLEQQDVNRCKYEEMSQLWRSQFLYDLYMGAIRNEELIKKQEEHYYPEIKRCAVITVDYSVDLSAQQQEEVQGILYRLFQGTLEHTTFDAVSFEDNTLSVIAVADADTLKEDEEALSIRLADLVMQADEAAGIKLCKVSVHTYKTLYAFSCRPRRMFHSAAGQESPELDGSSQAHFRLQQRALLSYISADDEEKAQALAGEMVLQLGNLSPAMAQMLVVDTAASI